MVVLSKYAKESMGFREISEGAPIEAKFQSIHVFSVQGIVVDDGTVEVLHPLINDVRCSLVLGNSPNELSRALAGDDFAEDEAAWSKQHGAQPPYLMVLLGPTAVHTCSVGHVKEHESGLLTYDAFPLAKSELRAAADAALPSLVTAVACTLSKPDHPVKVKKIDHTVFGLTTSGVTLHDLRFEMKGSLFVSRRLAPGALASELGRSASLAAALDPRVSRFYYLALEETDALKRFLYFFLSIEVETHAVFSKLDHAAHLSAMLVADAPQRSTSLSFLAGQRERWTSLKDRFLWCAICRWTHLSESDVREFGWLKRVRDNIAHGSLTTPPGDAVASVERLASQLQSAHS